MTAQACPTCGHVKVTRAAPRSITAPCADFRACWQWDHTCRSRIKLTASARRGTHAPAMLRGRVVQQERMSA